MRFCVLTLALCTLFPSALFAQTNCARDAYEINSLFSAQSSQLHAASKAGNVITENNLSEELFQLTKSLKSLAVSCQDARVPKLFRDSVAFLFLTHKDERLLALYEDFLRTTQLTKEQYLNFSDDFYLMNWQARNFEKLEDLKHEFPVSAKTTDFYPADIGASLNEDDMLFKARFTAGAELETYSENLDPKKLQLVVLVELLDGASRRLFDHVRQDPELFSKVDKILFLFSQTSVANPFDLANASQLMSDYDFAFVNNEDNWPQEIYFHHYPVFYFLHENKVLERIPGWPLEPEAQAKLVNDTYGRLQRELNQTED
ncbi:hypothetical protein IDSA_04840 [Pseudidiomarina salinarum]|uniref:DUF5106 domain-containing protein n=1 Tax=Pseudidiomarina salinarum TaxID=435908 RepID=A0A094JHH4_9GAMM|nr:hypothetical protein IDSA_04840 [Pseudidiomarina salinarum]RUO70217.1 hypothetical protein CWI79_01740 [Pseudidiomarina salinarum]